MVAVVTATAVICVVNSVTLPDFGLLLHEFGGEDRVACINMRLIGDTRYGLASPDMCPSPTASDLLRLPPQKTVVRRELYPNRP